MHEYEGGVTVQIRETEEIEEAKITKRIFHVSMEQVMVVTRPHNICGIGRRSYSSHTYMSGNGRQLWFLYCHTLQSESFVSVAQFHLHGWPKEGVPPSPQMMIELVERSRQHWRETGFNLIAVHTATEWVVVTDSYALINVGMYLIKTGYVTDGGF